MDITAIELRVTTYQDFHQLPLRHKEPQSVLLVLRYSKALAEVADESFHSIEICGIAFEDILVGVGIRFACLLVLEGFCPEVEMPLEHLAKSFNVCVHIV